MTVFRTANAITVSMDKCSLNLQIILRRYASVAQLLACFDVDACRTAYLRSEGLVLSDSFRRCVSTATILADKRWETPSFARRIDKYARLGFAVLADGLSPQYAAEHADAAAAAASAAGLAAVESVPVRHSAFLLSFLLCLPRIEDAAITLRASERGSLPRTIRVPPGYPALFFPRRHAPSSSPPRKPLSQQGAVGEGGSEKAPVRRPCST